MVKRAIMILILCLCSSPVFADVLIYKKSIEGEERMVECRIENKSTVFIWQTYRGKTRRFS